MVDAALSSIISHNRVGWQRSFEWQDYRVKPGNVRWNAYVIQLNTDTPSVVTDAGKLLYQYLQNALWKKKSLNSLELYQSTRFASRLQGNHYACAYLIASRSPRCVWTTATACFTAIERSLKNHRCEDLNWFHIVFFIRFFASINSTASLNLCIACTHNRIGSSQSCVKSLEKATSSKDHTIEAQLSCDTHIHV